MSIPGKLIIAILVACIASFAATALRGAGIVPEPTTIIAFIIATAATALLTHKPLAPPVASATPRAGAPAKPARRKPQAAAGAKREQGSVKWFNTSKGFGFITIDDGREVFVHFRSIRGEGRRGLQDGQRVSFIVAETDKGPQAEDVDTLD
jgi:CspA family cold shock protein